VTRSPHRSQRSDRIGKVAEHQPRIRKIEGIALRRRGGLSAQEPDLDIRSISRLTRDRQRTGIDVDTYYPAAGTDCARQLDRHLAAATADIQACRPRSKSDPG
jgi:hypothetical protein